MLLYTQQTEMACQLINQLLAFPPDKVTLLINDVQSERIVEVQKEACIFSQAIRLMLVTGRDVNVDGEPSCNIRSLS